MRDWPALQIATGRAPLDLVLAVVDDFAPTAVDELDGDSGELVRVYFADGRSRDLAHTALVARFPGAKVDSVDVPDENWAERSQANLKAIRAGDLTVAPPWDVPEGDGDRTIVILPAMGFGTGHHATTRLCLLALQQVGVAGKSVIDVGTGSGVLALAAAKLGAIRSVGIDNDQDAIDNALENRALNALDVRLARADLNDAVLDGPSDVVLANLTGAVLVRFARELSALAAPGGRLILSGLREEEEESVRAAFSRAVISRAEDEGWVCLVLG